MKVLIMYLIGTVMIGFPLAKLSLWFYTMGEDLDLPRRRWLKLLRNFIHPISFYGKGHVRNDPLNYAGPIRSLVNGYAPRRSEAVTSYLVSATFAWPLRIFLSLIAFAMALIVCIFCSPVTILNGICKIVARS